MILGSKDRNININIMWPWFELSLQAAYTNKDLCSFVNAHVPISIYCVLSYHQWRDFWFDVLSHF